MKVTGFHSSSLDRQVTERVNIENFQGPVLMNRRNVLGGVRLERVQYRRWAVIKGSKKGGPPTLGQPASQQGGEEEENILAGGAWRGLEVCWGCGWIFGMCSSIPGRQGVARWPRPTLGQGVAQWELSLLGTCFWRELLLGRIYFQSLVSCGLAGLPHVPVFSRVGGDEMNQMKVKVLSLFLDLIVNFS